MLAALGFRFGPIVDRYNQTKTKRPEGRLVLLPYILSRIFIALCPAPVIAGLHDIVGISYRTCLHYTYLRQIACSQNLVLSWQMSFDLRLLKV